MSGENRSPFYIKIKWNPTMGSEGIAKDVLNRLNRYKWAIFLTLVIGYFFVYFQRMSVSVVGSDIVDEVGGSIGILSTVYFWTYTAMQIPSGLMADRFGPRIACTLFLLLASIGSFITSVGTEFWMMIVGKVMIAAGMAVVYIPLMKLISVWFPKQDFAVLNGIVIAVGNVGAVAASGPLDMLADAIGWRDVFLVLGLITLTLSILCVAVIRDHPHQRGLPSVEEVENKINGTAVTESSAARMPMLRGLAVIASGGRRFWCCALAYFLVYGSIMTFQGTWAIKYFDSVYEFAFAASWMVTMIGIGKILTTVTVGALTTRGVLKSKRKTMIFGTGCFAVIWAVVFLFAGEIDSYWFWFLISFLFGFFGGFMTLSFTQVKEWYPIAISGTAVSGMNIFLFLGASISTSISSFVIGTTYSLEDFATLWGIMFVFSVVAFILMVLSKEKGKDDLPIGLDRITGDDTSIES